MATTRLIALHAGAGSIESAPGRSTDYIENGAKTNGGELVTSYQCDPLTAPQEFALAKREYAIKTGRNQGGRDVIAYHLRQSFLPGEIDAETAAKVAWETVMSLTHGKHAFVIAVHAVKSRSARMSPSNFPTQNGSPGSVLSPQVTTKILSAPVCPVK